MIIRDGIYNTTNRIVRYNGWPVYIKNRYNTVGYIPAMTSNTTPVPYIAGGAGDISLPRIAFDGNDGTYARLIIGNGIQESYIQIYLERPISIWKVRILLTFTTATAFKPAELYISDVHDNKICDVPKGDFDQIRDNTIILSTPSNKLDYYRLVMRGLNNITSFAYNVYTFQIYAFD